MFKSWHEMRTAFQLLESERDKYRAERDELRAENAELRVLLGWAMDDLKYVYDIMYPAREQCPDEMRHYERDMDLVNRIHTALSGEGEK